MFIFSFLSSWIHQMTDTILQEPFYLCIVLVSILQQTKNLYYIENIVFHLPYPYYLKTLKLNENLKPLPDVLFVYNFCCKSGRTEVRGYWQAGHSHPHTQHSQTWPAAARWPSLTRTIFRLISSHHHTITQSHGHLRTIITRSLSDQARLDNWIMYESGLTTTVITM